MPLLRPTAKFRRTPTRNTCEARAPTPPRPTACGVRLEFGEIIFFYQKKIEPETTSRHRPGAPPRTARANRSAIVARRSSIADRRSAVGLGKETAGRRSTLARPVLKLQKCAFRASNSHVGQSGCSLRVFFRSPGTSQAGQEATH